MIFPKIIFNLFFLLCHRFFLKGFLLDKGIARKCGGVPENQAKIDTRQGKTAQMGGDLTPGAVREKL